MVFKCKSRLDNQKTYSNLGCGGQTKLICPIQPYKNSINKQNQKYSV